ncbi:MAG: hypothetical protein QM667_14265 [Asticcacaulis sp.]
MKPVTTLSAIALTAALSVAAALPASAQLLGGQGGVTGGLTGQIDRSQTTVNGALGAQGQVSANPGDTLDKATDRTRDTLSDTKAKAQTTTDNAYNTANKAQKEVRGESKEAVTATTDALPSVDANATVSGDGNASTDGASANATVKADAKVEKK